jgi:uncharacterized protein involved in exopolysaccharide biosynthesis
MNQPQQPPVTGARGPSERGEVTLLDLATVLIKHWRLIVGLPVLGAIAAVLISFAMRPSYSASTSFVPEGGPNSRLPAGLAGLAGQFGVSLGADASRSPRFYADVLKSREVLERVLRSYYADPRPTAQRGDTIRLLDLLMLNGRSPTDTLSKGVRRLRNSISTQVDNQTSIVRLTVDSRYPDLAAGMANRLVAYLNDFNAQTRQSQARERRKFVEQRVATAEVDLRGAEAATRSFLERNRSWQQSPQLVFEEGRLRRQVDIRQDVYLTLNREYETAKIEEVNDTPVITVIDPAVAPQVKSSPRRSLLMGLGMVLGAVLGVFVAFGREYLERSRQEGDVSYRTFTSVLAGALQELKRVVPTRAPRS